MKHKKRKSTDFLKLGVLLFGVLLFWNCEKEDEQIILQDSLSEILQSEFNSEEFTETLPYKYEVDWSNPKKQFSEQLKTSFYEFPIVYTDAFNPKIFNKQKKRDFYKKYKIVVTEKQDGKFDFFIARYYLKNNGENPDVENTIVGLNLNSGYEGTVHLYDKEGKIVFAKHVNRKDKSEDFFLENESDSLDDKGKPLAKGPPIIVCKTVTKSVYAERYWVVVDRYGNIISSTYIGTFFVRYIQVEECHEEWLPDNNDDECVEIVDGLCVYEPQPIPTPVCREGYIPDENGNCVEQETLGGHEGLISASAEINTILDLSLTREQLLWLSENNKAAENVLNFLNQNLNSVTAEYFAKFAIGALVNSGEVDFDERLVYNPNLDQDYLSMMSQQERSIFDTLSNLQKLQYLTSAQQAWNYTEIYYEDSFYNGKGDAFRHAFFNALSTVRLGSDLTKRLTDAHETKPHPDSNYTNHYKEKQMDLFNNAVGIETAYGSGRLYQLIEQALINGNLRYLSHLLGGGSQGRATDLSELTPTNQ